MQPLQSKGAYGPRDFDKYIWALDIPLYDPDNATHQAIVVAAKAARDAAQKINVDDMGFQHARREIRDHVDLHPLNAAVTALLDRPDVVDEQ